MKRVSIVAIVVLIAAAMVSVGGVAANAQSNEAPKATEVGVTADTIRIAIVADVDNPFAPGLFQSAVDSVRRARTTRWATSSSTSPTGRRWPRQSTAGR